MRPVDIDFDWKPYTRVRLAGIGMLVAALVGLSVQAWAYVRLQEEAAVWQASRHRLDRLASPPRAKETPEDRERLQAELRLASRVIDKLDLPWDSLFGAVEANAGDQAILLGVEPDAERREIRLTGEAKDATAMLDYLRGLRVTSVLKDAHLTGQQINAQDAQRPVRFTIDAQWVESPPVAQAPASVPAEGGKP